MWTDRLTRAGDYLMTDQILAEIAGLMEAQAGVFAGLLDLARRKKDALIAGNLPDLDEIVKGEQALLWQGGRLEDRRYRLQQDLALTLGADPESMTLGQALKAAGDDLRERFQDLQQNLGTILEGLDDLNQINQQLLEQSLSFVNYSIQIISQARGQSPTYGADGRVDGGKPDPRRRVDTKA